MSEDYSTDIEEVKVSVENAVVSWSTKTQINPTTGEVFDFNGVSISPPVVTPSGDLNPIAPESAEIPVDATAEESAS